MTKKEMGPGLLAEYILCSMIRVAAINAGPRLPMRWFGTINALDLYLRHPHYSPFLPLPKDWAEGSRERLTRSLVNRRFSSSATLPMIEGGPGGRLARAEILSPPEGKTGKTTL